MVLVTLDYIDREGRKLNEFIELNRIPIKGETLQLNEKEKYTVKEVIKNSLNPEKSSKATVFLEK